MQNTNETAHDVLENPSVAGTTTAQPVATFPQLYLDLVWNLADSARMMRFKLPGFATATKDPELAALISQCVTLATQHHEGLMSIVSHIGQPALVHAGELGDLLGTRERQLAGASTSVRDVGFANVIRTVLHLAIPSYELGKKLAKGLGFESQDRSLDRFQRDCIAMDARLAQMLERLVARRDDLDVY